MTMSGRGGAEAGEFQPLLQSRGSADGREDNLMRSYGAPTANSLTEEQVDELRFLSGIRVDGETVPAPVQHFADITLPSCLSQRLAQQGFTSPTPVQTQTLPCQLAGRDVMVIAETGSGKTLAYCLPLVLLLSKYPPVLSGSSPRALVLVPSRELARQVEDELSALLACLPPPPLPPHTTAAMPPHTTTTMPPHTIAPTPVQASPFGPAPPAVPHGHVPMTTVSGYRCLSVLGGEPVQPQVNALKRGIDAVVATPGRLLDLVERGAVRLDSISYLVMDEADQMLSRGFEDQLRKIVGLATSRHIPRQTSLWSATLPESLERLARSAVLNPITIHVGFSGLTARGISQDVLFMHHYQKPKKLLEVLRRTTRPPVLVFCSNGAEVNEVVEHLRTEQFHVAALHADLPQSDRNAAIDAFRNDKCDVLVATDLASRGINIPSISRVINYSLPLSLDVYIHRCGRTSRMGVGGDVTSFLTLDCKIASELRDLLRECEQNVPLELEDVKQFGRRIIVTEFGDRLATN